MEYQEYWRQIKRTVNREPVSFEQIEMIVRAICEGLDLNGHPDDALLDIGCGNGALASLFFDKIKKYHGVDLSEFLISVAKRDFERPPDYLFEVSDVVDYLKGENSNSLFNKVLFYGCFSYFQSAEEVLGLIRNKFVNVEKIFIGNLPDAERVSDFYKETPGDKNILSDCSSSIGVWRTKDEFRLLAQRSGWCATFSQMPPEFYAAHYRYDVTLVRDC